MLNLPLLYESNRFIQTIFFFKINLKNQLLPLLLQPALFRANKNKKPVILKTKNFNRLILKPLGLPQKSGAARSLFSNVNCSDKMEQNQLLNLVDMALGLVKNQMLGLTENLTLGLVENTTIGLVEDPNLTLGVYLKGAGHRWTTFKGV